MFSRYFIQLAYNGTEFCGWQIQPNDPTVQETIEQALSTLYNQPTRVVGCGRTDTGVHASDYYLHVDLGGQYSERDLVFKLNCLLPKSINIFRAIKVADDAHTRFDASSRSYVYKMSFVRDPFRQKTLYRFDQSGRPEFEKMNAAVALLLEYNEFFPFCKTHADTETYNCRLTQSEWIKISEEEWHYKVTADRFLRGMVRMIVGMSLNVGLGRLSISEVKEVMDKQQRLEKAWSVPALGLFLDRITYPYI